MKADVDLKASFPLTGSLGTWPRSSAGVGTE